MTVRVVFRKWKWQKDGQGIIALFPDKRTGLDGMVTCFEHVGQHGAADYSMVISRTRPASAGEYENLKKELESAPYNYVLTVIKRALAENRRP